MPDHPRPSVNTELPWLFAFDRTGERCQLGPDCGKWTVFVPLSRIDEAWAIVQAATEAGELGAQSKVSTEPNPNGRNRDERVICVFTHDANDEADVMRVREELRRLGVKRPISYKMDAATEAGRYSRPGVRVGRYRV